MLHLSQIPVIRGNRVSTRGTDFDATPGALSIKFTPVLPLLLSLSLVTLNECKSPGAISKMCFNYARAYTYAKPSRSSHHPEKGYL